MADEFEIGGGNRVADVVSALEKYFGAAGLGEPRLKAEHLIAHHLGCRRLELALRADEPVSAEVAEHVKRAAERMAAGEPLQYVIGRVNFMGLELVSDYRALIPRPETEELVELVLGCGALRARKEPIIVDVGTGSGCIAVALAAAWPHAHVEAVDISAEALALARENALRLGVEKRITFARGDLLADMSDDHADAIVANLPYVRSADWARLPREIRSYEPRDALDGGKDGLGVISRLVPEAVRVLKSGGWLFLEIGEEHGREVSEQMRGAGLLDVCVQKDMSGLPRFVTGRKP